MISFCNNRALYGGAISANDHSNITVTGNSVLSLILLIMKPHKVVGLDILAIIAM